MVFDLSGYASLDGLHAVQWDDAVAYGHIEFDNSLANATTFKPNEQITSVAPYQDIIDAWYAMEAEAPPPSAMSPPPQPPEMKRA